MIGRIDRCWIAVFRIRATRRTRGVSIAIVLIAITITANILTTAISVSTAIVLIAATDVAIILTIVASISITIGAKFSC